jgi:hypothetical protein
MLGAEDIPYDEKRTAHHQADNEENEYRYVIFQHRVASDMPVSMQLYDFYDKYL